MDKLLKFIVALPEGKSTIRELSEIMHAAGLEPGRTLVASIMKTVSPLLSYVQKNGSIDDLRKYVSIVCAILKSHVPEGTRVTYLSKIRTIAAKALGPDSSANAIVREITKKASHDITTKRNKLYEEYVAAKAGDRDIIDFDKLRKLFDITYATRNEDLVDAIIAAIIASGSRITEILSVGIFEEVLPSSKDIKQIGLAKKRTQTGESVVKPVLFITPIEFLDLMKGIRTRISAKLKSLDSKKSWTPEQIVGHFQKDVNRRINELMPGREQHISSHKLRAAYASVAYQLYADKDKITLQKYISQVLGHAQNNITTANTYANTTVKGATTGGAIPQQRTISQILREIAEREGKSRIRARERVCMTISNPTMRAAAATASAIGAALPQKNRPTLITRLARPVPSSQVK